jgi:hypothetical protein
VAADAGFPTSAVRQRSKRQGNRIIIGLHTGRGLIGEWWERGSI